MDMNCQKIIQKLRDKIEYLLLDLELELNKENLEQFYNDIDKLYKDGMRSNCFSEELIELLKDLISLLDTLFRVNRLDKLSEIETKSKAILVILTKQKTSNKF